mmetsp:Transcript_17073/g.26723  ORF Transcript_17073/g.26723 Transcript_17073/m.26723 type:complete len:183 (-) Transcript_17073:556-1104(-)
MASSSLSIVVAVVAAMLQPSVVVAFTTPHAHLQKLSTTQSSMLPSQSQLFDTVNHNIPSLLISETLPEEAFQDQVSLSDLTSDPVMQASFAAAAIAIIILFVLKSVVTKMDDAVEKVAIDFDRVMKMKYKKKWERFMVEEGDETALMDEGDRIQMIVEQMELYRDEEPAFYERVMRDIERMQ